MSLADRTLLSDERLSALAALFDRVPMGVAFFDRKLCLRRCNSAWAGFAGRRVPAAAGSAVPGVRLSDLIPEAELDSTRISEQVLSGDPVRLDALPIEEGGEVSYWDVLLAPLVDGEQVAGAVAVATDVTGRESVLREMARSVDALREREERLNLALRGANDGVWDWNLETGEVYYSHRWKAMLGYEEDEVANRFESWRHLVHPDDLERALATVQSYLDGRAPAFELEHRLRHKDGSYRWVLARGISVQSADGRPHRMVGSHTDVTDRKRVEQALQHQNRFENIVTTISTNFISLTPGEIDDGISGALEVVGEFTAVDRSYVFLFSGDGRTMDCTHEWCAEGVEPQIDHMQDVPVDALAWSNEILLRGDVLHIPRVADLPPEARTEKAEFRSQRIQSLLAVPMIYLGSVLGFLGFDSVRAEKTWAEESIKLLKIVGEIFVNALEHRRAQAIQAGQRQFLELLATGGSFSETLHALVRIIEEQWPGMLGLVLLLDEDGIHLHHGAAISLPEEYTQSIEGLEIGPMVGSCGTACFLGERVIVEDIATDPRWEGLRDLAMEYGLRACWSQPVFSSDGQVVGTFAMYYRHPRAPTQAELRTIGTAAHLVGIAVQHRRTQEALEQAWGEMETRVQQRTAELRQANALLQQEIAQRVQAEEALRRSEAKYRDLVENANSIILQLDPSGNITFFNRFAEEFFGYTEEEILGRNILDTIVPPSDRDGDDLKARFRDLLRHPARYDSNENENVRRNGERVWVAWTNRPIYDQDGRLAGILCIGIDRTEQRQAQDVLAQQVREKAVAAERNRLARDLHDAVTQTLFSASLIAEVLPRIWERDRDEGQRRLEELRELNRGALAEMRTLLLELRPSALVEAELADLLRQLAESITGRARVPVTLDVEGACDLPAEVKVALYRIGQEALNNVAKHAGASQATVSLRCQPGRVSLHVRDDGRGFDPASLPLESLGLGIMRERAEAIGAKLTIESAVEQGTRVRVVWTEALDQTGDDGRRILGADLVT